MEPKDDHDLHDVCDEFPSEDEGGMHKPIWTKFTLPEEDTKEISQITTVK